MIAIFGDVILDSYLFGKVKRISPEAPVPVLNVDKKKDVLGGAANVANNIISLKNRCFLFSKFGKDEKLYRLLDLLNEKNIFHYILDNYTSIEKQRVIASNQQLLRIDFEKITFLEDKDVEKIKEKFLNLENINLVIFSDYKKGFCTDTLVKEIISICKEKNIKVIVDTKEKNLEKYKGAFIITPNLNEISNMVGREVKNEEKDVVEAAKELIEKYNFENVLVTRSEKGMTLVKKDGTYKTFYVKPKEVYDVSGAGDTVVATLANFLSLGYDLEKACKLANIAASIVVGKLGTAPIYLEELEEYLNGNTKIYSLKDLLKKVKKWKEEGKTIVWTNGCFDILHAGHVTYLKEAKKLGDILIVGLNSDESVKRLKGKDRPINPVEDRAKVLEALECVDAIIIFDENTPYNIIKKIKPDIIVKGGDYKEEEVIGREFAKRVVIMPYIEGKSTTNIIRKIKENG